MPDNQPKTHVRPVLKYRFKIKPETAFRAICDLRRARFDHGRTMSGHDTCRLLAQNYQLPAQRMYYALWCLRTDIIVSVPPGGMTWLSGAELTPGATLSAGGLKRIRDLPLYRVKCHAGHWLLSYNDLHWTKLCQYTADPARSTALRYSRWGAFGVSERVVDRMINLSFVHFRY